MTPRVGYERRHEPLLPRSAFAARMARHASVGAAVIALALAIGVLGYHALAGLAWVDAIENAAMILSGMGPVTPMQSTAAKLFASGYALFSGVVFISSIGVVIAPALHRLLHHFHLESRQDADEP
jgi:hypothetical protein